MRSQLRIALALAAAVSISQLAAAPPVAAATDALPDLKMAPLYDLKLVRKNGHVRLRFGAIVWNIGQGPLEARGSQRIKRRMTKLTQVIHATDGSTRSVTATGITAFYAGDHHDHWHVSNFVETALYPTGTGAAPAPSDVRSLRKIGFCLTDLVRVPQDLRPTYSPRAGYPYTGCGRSSSQQFKMGISVGWGDDYKSWFAHQAIDITRLKAGDYRLCATPNPHGGWLEIDRTNNSYWVDLHINLAANELTVLGDGETECQPGATTAAQLSLFVDFFSQLDTVEPDRLISPRSGPGIRGGLRSPKL